MALDSTKNQNSDTSFVIDGPSAIFYGEQKCDLDSTTYVDTTTGGGKLLGYTDGGVTISSRVITHRINGDEFGGSEGIPAELLILGAQASIRATIVKWAPNVFIDIASGLLNPGLLEGEIPDIGTTYFGYNYGFSFWVLGRTACYFFPKCELATQPREWNVSSLEKRMQLNVNAYNVFASSGCIVFAKGTESWSWQDACTGSFVDTNGNNYDGSSGS